MTKSDIIGMIIFLPIFAALMSWGLAYNLEISTRAEVVQGVDHDR